MTPIGYLKLGGALIVTLTLAWVAYVVHGWHQDSLRVAALEAHTAQVEREAAETIANLQAAQAASQEASKGLQDELQSLRSARKPAPVVRLQQPAKVVSADQAGTGRNGSTPGAGELPQEAGRDIGPDLYGLADEADEVAARLRACQALLK